MVRKLSLDEVAERNDCESINELLDQFGLESVVPACCDEECQVEPDGYCEHGHPSILVELGII
jgi:hypothetical protein